MADIVIFYELPERELNNANLLKAEFEKRGYSVDILGYYNYRELIFPRKYKPKLLIGQAGYNNNDIERYTVRFKPKIDKILNLRYEHEYSGVVTIGIDVSRVTVEVDGTKVTISIPAAEVLRYTVDSSSLTEDSYIVAKDSAAIEAEDEIAAFSVAQADLEATASQDTALLASAQQQAQQLLEDYITNIGKATGKSYSIEWIYLDENNVPVGSEQTAPGTMEESSAPAEGQ